MKYLLLAIFACACAFAQVRDAYPRNANHGSALPGTCSVGDTFQLTSASIAAQWYACTSTNTWTAQGGGGTSGFTLQNQGSGLGTVTTFNCSTNVTCSAAGGVGTITAAGGTGTGSVNAPIVSGSLPASTVVIGSNCSPTSCSVLESGSLAVPVTATNTLTAPTSGSGTVYIFSTSSSAMVVGSPGSSTVGITGSGPAVNTTGITGYYTSGSPNPTFIMAHLSFGGGQWTSYTNEPGVVSLQPQGGTGIIPTYSQQNVSFAIDPSVVMTQGMTTTANFAGFVKLGYNAGTFASLPSCGSGNQGLLAWINDGPTSSGGTTGSGAVNSWGAGVSAGGGAYTLLLICDGAGTWRVFGL